MRNRSDMRHEPWIDLLGTDPREWLLASGEPAARWVTLTRLLDLPADDPDVVQTRAEVLADPGVRALLDCLTPWDQETPLSGHDKPTFAPNFLSLLGDMGVRPQDDPRFAGVLASMLEHQDPEGRFQSFGRWRGMDTPLWGALLCDAHAIAETLARFGHADDPRVIRAFDRMAEDLVDTDQGCAWPCRPDPGTGFRGPGRRSEFCPQVTLEALRAASYLPPARRPPAIVEAGRISLRAWRERGREKPYMFGHGRQFKRVKWPVTWYGAYEMADVLGRYPELWGGVGADGAPAGGTAASAAVSATDGAAASGEALAADRRALAEVVACLVAYNVDRDSSGALTGRVTPRSCFKGFERHSFGQKKQPSPFATACLAAVVRRLDALAPLVAEVDVLALPSSKGGSGIALPP